MTATVALPEVDRVEILTLLDLSLDLLMAGSETVRRADVTGTLGEGRSTLRAEHGFSSLVTVVRGDRRESFLFDAGLTKDALVHNMDVLRHAMALTGIGRVHAVLGGFHLTGRLFEPLIAPTIAALQALAPRLIVPSHCTGWKAVHEIARVMPDAFVPNSVGTTFLVGVN